MRKKLWIVLAVIVLLLLSFVSWLQYRQYSSWKIPVHEDIKTVARVNTDALIKIFIAEYGLNFSKKISKKKDSPTTDSKNTGIYFPGNIFIYNISTRLPSTFFCTLPVHDLKDFLVFAKSKFDIQLVDSAGIYKGVSTDGKFMIACNSDYISISYSAEKEEVFSDLLKVLSSKKVLAQNELLYSQLKEVNYPIAISNGFYNATIDVSGTKLLFQSNFKNLSNVNIPAAPKQMPANDSSNLFLSLNYLPGKSRFKPIYNLKDFSIETDSVLKYYNGYAELQIGSSVNQLDTITTYEYDDNFDKVAKQTINDVKVPNIGLSVAIKPGMLAYLQRISLVNEQHKLNKDIFPLYSVNVEETNQMLYLSTGIKTGQQQVFTNTNNFLALNMDVKKTVAALGFPYFDQYIKKIISIKFTGHQKNGLVVVDGVVNFEGSAIKAMVEIFKSY